VNEVKMLKDARDAHHNGNDLGAAWSTFSAGASDQTGKAMDGIADFWNSITGGGNPPPQ
jgi:hypothetical protein